MSEYQKSMELAVKKTRTAGVLTVEKEVIDNRVHYFFRVIHRKTKKESKQYLLDFEPLQGTCGGVTDNPGQAL